MAGNRAMVPAERIERSILLVRGHKVMLDEDLAALYEVEVKVLNQAVKRNIDRFPEDFMFQLTAEEFANLRYQSGASTLKSQIVTLKTGRGRHRKYPPYAFTEQGVAAVARAAGACPERSRRMRLRQMLASHADLARKLAALEKKYDAQFKVVFDAIRELMAPPGPKRRRIGFRAEDKG